MPELVENRLVILEGIPSSGKSTLAAALGQRLEACGRQIKLFQEGDPGHPADYESVARFTREDFLELIQAQTEFAAISEPYLDVLDQDVLIAYGRMMADWDIPDAVRKQMYSRDIYESSTASEYAHLLITRWREFVEDALQEESVHVFECCFLQNPITMMIGKLDAGEEAVRELILELTEIIKPLKPAVIYLDQKDPAEALVRIASRRPEQWRDFIIEYFTEQGWGKRKGLSGFEGPIRFYEKMRELQLGLGRQLQLQWMEIDNTSRADNWQESALEKIGL